MRARQRRCVLCVCVYVCCACVWLLTTARLAHETSELWGLALVLHG